MATKKKQSLWGKYCSAKREIRILQTKFDEADGIITHQNQKIDELMEETNNLRVKISDLKIALMREKQISSCMMAPKDVKEYQEWLIAKRAEVKLQFEIKKKTSILKRLIQWFK
jgi:hypothetical protein